MWEWFDSKESEEDSSEDDDDEFKYSLATYVTSMPAYCNFREPPPTSVKPTSSSSPRMPSQEYSPLRSPSDSEEEHKHEHEQEGPKKSLFHERRPVDTEDMEDEDPDWGGLHGEDWSDTNDTREDASNTDVFRGLDACTRYAKILMFNEESGPTAEEWGVFAEDLFEHEPLRAQHATELVQTLRCVSTQEEIAHKFLVRALALDPSSPTFPHPELDDVYILAVGNDDVTKCSFHESIKSMVEAAGNPPHFKNNVFTSTHGCEPSLSAFESILGISRDQLFEYLSDDSMFAFNDMMYGSKASALTARQAQIEMRRVFIRIYELAWQIQHGTKGNGQRRLVVFTHGYPMMACIQTALRKDNLGEGANPVYFRPRAMIKQKANNMKILTAEQQTMPMVSNKHGMKYAPPTMMKGGVTQLRVEVQRPISSSRTETCRTRVRIVALPHPNYAPNNMYDHQVRRLAIMDALVDREFEHAMPTAILTLGSLYDEDLPAPRHGKTKHPSKIHKANPTVKVGPYQHKCDVCETTFRTRQGALNHQSIKHGRARNRGGRGTKRAPAKRVDGGRWSKSATRTLKCKFCDDYFKTTLNRGRHYRNDHGVSAAGQHRSTTCKCGSTTHTRISHAECPMNRKNLTTIEEDEDEDEDEDEVLKRGAERDVFDFEDEEDGCDEEAHLDAEPGLSDEQQAARDIEDDRSESEEL